MTVASVAVSQTTSVGVLVFTLPQELWRKRFSDLLAC